MSTDWIKVRKSLPTSPRFVRMMSALKADKFQTLGGVLSAWMIFDDHSTDGHLLGYTPSTLDQVVGFEGLTMAMEGVGWVEVTPDGLQAVDFEEHNGATAKRRAMDAARKGSARRLQNVRNDADKMRNREDKIREDKLSLIHI